MNSIINKTLVLASGNQGKLQELVQMLKPIGFEVRAQSDFDVPEADEIGLSFIENAIIKARNAAEYSGLPALADDSGLCVAALEGAPGIYSARYSGKNATDATNNQKLLSELAGESNRKAWFHCAAVFVRHAKDPQPIIAEASWHGEILSQPKGSQGFGYDPLFYVESLGKTSAELAPEIKNTVSHRGQAVQALVAAIGQAAQS